MHQPNWVAEFWQKLVSGRGQPAKNMEEHPSSLTRWLQLADQLLSTDNPYDDAT